MDTVESLTPSWLTTMHCIWAASEPVGRIGGLIFIMYLGIWVAVAMVNRGRRYLRQCWRRMPLDYETEADRERRRRQMELMPMDSLPKEGREGRQSSSPIQSRGDVEMDSDFTVIPTPANVTTEGEGKIILRDLRVLSDLLMVSKGTR